MARVAFVVHPEREQAAALARDSARWLEEHGHLALPGPATTGVAGCDLVVSLGGDGTMLRAVELAHPEGVPVLGVNLGRLGYLTAVEPGSLIPALASFLAGERKVEERMTLEVALESRGATGPARPPLVALNEAVVEKAAPGHTVELGVSVAGRPFLTYAADGVIVATPTGSTAYSLSSRGPIVSPRLRAVVVTPVSPHMLFDRALVLEPGEPVRIDVLGERPATLVVDGSSGTFPLAPGDAVVCSASPRPALLVDSTSPDFHSILKAKFGLADRRQNLDAD